MYALWSRPDAPPATSLVLASEFNASAAAAPLADAIEGERERHRSIDLLRERAFRARECTAEQQVQNQAAELANLRTLLESERQTAQTQHAALQAELETAK